MLVQALLQAVHEELEASNTQAGFLQGFLLQESSCRLWSRKAWVEAGGGAGAGGGGAASRQFHYRRLPPVCQRLATMYQLPPAPPSALLAQLLHRQPRERLREFSLQETKDGFCQKWDEQHSVQSLKDLPKYARFSNVIGGRNIMSDSAQLFYI